MTDKYQNLKWTFQSQLNGLEKDAKIILSHEQISFEAKTIITLWLLILIDRYSGMWAGYKKSQTKRMIDFLERYLNYDREESRAAIKIWRHSLAHTGHPKMCAWQWNYQNPSKFHWKLEKAGPPENTYRLYFGFYNLLNDLRAGMQKYCEEIAVYEELQNNYERYLGEIL